MTYCVGLRIDRGLIMMSDTRTNAGVDNISTFSKMSVWEVPDERVITILSAGNLATTQATVSMLDERAKAPEDRDPSILKAPSMFQVARIVGRTLRDAIQASVGPNQDSGGFSGTLIVAGQIKGSEPRIFMVYPEGNFIEATHDTPYFQIGEAKYGKPILVRAYDKTMSFEDAVKLLFVSFDSTIKANLSVGLPLDVHVYERDSFKIGRRFRVRGDDDYYQMISSGWGEALKDAFYRLPPFKFGG